jgi:hypothetical protein
MRNKRIKTANNLLIKYNTSFKSSKEEREYYEGEYLTYDDVHTRAASRPLGYPTPEFVFTARAINDRTREIGELSVGLISNKIIASILEKHNQYLLNSAKKLRRSVMKSPDSIMKKLNYLIHRRKSRV